MNSHGVTITLSNSIQGSSDAMTSLGWFSGLAGRGASEWITATQETGTSSTRDRTGRRTTRMQCAWNVWRVIGKCKVKNAADQAGEELTQRIPWDDDRGTILRRRQY